MALNVNQALAGQPLRAPTVGESLVNQRGSPPKKGVDAVGEVQSKSQAQKSAQAAEAAQAPAGGLQAMLAAEAEAVDLNRAVEQANALAESALRATNRSVTFARDDGSGRMTITIREEVDGEEVSRQIPPNHFLKVVERLRQLQESGDAPRGALIDIDG